MARYRYKRGRRGYRRNSTRSIMMKFQSFMDISTTDESMQIITISAGGPEILKRLSPQFGAYKYYKIGNIAVKLVPASTLPVDPTGLSLAVGEPGVDPRDQLTPGMMRITNGEDIFEDISSLTDAEQHAIYNNMLLDPRWFKWMLQSGVKRHATPRYWQIGQLHQDKWPGMVSNYPVLSESGTSFIGTDHMYEFGQQNVHAADVLPVVDSGSSPYGFFQTGHRGVLGWLPTDGFQPIGNANGSITERPFIAAPPEVEVMKIILPKAYKTRYYYRMFVTETVYFKDPIVNFGIPAGKTIGGDEYFYRPLDVFHDATQPFPARPSDARYDNLGPERTGGNYGDN